MYDTLVLSGNSTNAISTLGTVQRLINDLTLDIQYVKTFYGTSSGSIISLLLAIGMEPIEILATMCANNSFSKVSRLNISSGGLMSFDPIESELEQIVVSRLGYIPTMGQILDRYGKNLVFVTFNMTDGVKEYVSSETHADIPVTIAVKMSSTFPFIFSPFEYRGKYYVDGGVVDNFAMTRAQRSGGKCLGICNVNTIKPYTPTMNSVELCFRLFSVFMDSFADSVDALPGNRIVKLTYAPSFFNFTSTNSELVALFDDGYDKCKNMTTL